MHQSSSILPEARTSSGWLAGCLNGCPLAYLDGSLANVNVPFSRILIFPHRQAYTGEHQRQDSTLAFDIYMARVM